MVKLTSDGHYVLDFYIEHARSLQQQRERRRTMLAEQSAKRRRERRGSLRHTLDLMELPESHLTASELEMCDAYIKKATQAVQSTWSQTDEAQRRGVDIRLCAKVFVSDGRLFQDDFAVSCVSTGDLCWEDGDYD